LTRGMGDLKKNEDRTLKVDGLVNGRDLGGLKRTDGTVTPRGVFFRSENDAADFTDEDRKSLFTWRGATITPPNPAE
jgi:hypothetical protein